jgi:XTP/dITP diphosphohydrolase
LRVVLATGNKHKVDEVRRILEPRLDIDIVTVHELAVEETGDTLTENALIKARAYAAATGLPAIADDSGLCVDALDGAPGVLSARWAGLHGDDAANLELVLAQVADVPDERRGASFVCVAALVTTDGVERTVEGRVDGTLTREPRGAGGFGYDPIFVPLGETRTTAQLAPADKDAISHRGRAFRALAPVLADLLNL